jgi:molybdopterin-guanine dinucleotide biosynthesis protein A
MESVAAVILAGGLARRMEGRNKALLDIHGMTLIERIFSTLQTQCDQIVINTNGPSDPYDFLKIECVSDTVKGHIGPAAGLLAGLHYCRDHKYLLCVACDTPFLPADLVEKLKGRLKGEDSDVCVARSNDRTHYVISLWKTDVLAHLEQLVIKDKIRAMKKILDHFKVSYQDWSIDPFDPFMNINNAADLETARLIAKP